jgi:ADP-heptose:LPS heptosyltransferase
LKHFVSSFNAMISKSDRFKAQFAAVVKSALNFCLRFMRVLLFLRLRPPLNPKRIAVHLIGNVGDIVIAIPALIALRERYPESYLMLFTSAGHRDKNLAGAYNLLEGVKFLDRIEPYALEDISHPKGILNLLRRFRRLRPELMVSLPPCDIPFISVARNLIFARMTGARFAVGYDHINMWLFPFAQAQRFGTLPSEISRNFRHLRELGVDTSKVRFEFGPVDEAEKRRIQNVLQGRKPFVVLCPGGKQAGHRWPAERFAEVASRLRRLHGINLVAVGSMKERELCQEVLDHAGGGINFAGEISLRGALEVLSQARFLLTNDTGPMHLAAARGTPVAAIFGTKDFAGRWTPYGEGHEVFRAVLYCQQCLFAPEESDHCVKQISVEEVYAGCLRLLERASHRRRNGSSESRVDEQADEKSNADVEPDAALTTIE